MFLWPCSCKARRWSLFWTPSMLLCNMICCNSPLWLLTTGNKAMRERESLRVCAEGEPAAQWKRKGVNDGFERKYKESRMKGSELTRWLPIHLCILHICACTKHMRDYVCECAHVFIICRFHWNMYGMASGGFSVLFLVTLCHTGPVMSWLIAWMYGLIYIFSAQVTWIIMSDNTLS